MTKADIYYTELGCYSDLFIEVANILNSKGLKPYGKEKYTSTYIRKVMNGKLEDEIVKTTLKNVAKRKLSK